MPQKWQSARLRSRFRTSAARRSTAPTSWVCWCHAPLPMRRRVLTNSIMNKPLNKMAVQAKINGESTAFLCSPGQVLAEVLRDELELIGTKIGCNTGDCGACSVLVDDRLVCSCLVLAAEVEGRSVQTVEGVANGGELHPVQQKLLEYGGCSAVSARRGGHRGQGAVGAQPGAH